ncbi:hypothetical protein B0H19DRAFT_1193247 [Mycena capillaripes]|nr:hypothetical protein B0H19DRAFT_1193247 [Mycena capillaripes]
MRGRDQNKTMRYKRHERQRGNATRAPMRHKHQCDTRYDRRHDNATRRRFAANSPRTDRRHDTMSTGPPTRCNDATRRRRNTTCRGTTSMRYDRRRSDTTSATFMSSRRSGGERERHVERVARSGCGGSAACGGREARGKCASFLPFLLSIPYLIPFSFDWPGNLRAVSSLDMGQFTPDGAVCGTVNAFVEPGEGMVPERWRRVNSGVAGGGLSLVFAMS